MLCKKCDSQLPDGAAFCPSCGAPSSGTQPQETVPHTTATTLSSPKTVSPFKVIKYIIFLLLFLSFKAIRLVACILAILAVPVYLIIFIIQHARKKPKRKWGIACLLAVGIIFLTAAVNHIDNAIHNSENPQIDITAEEVKYTAEEKEKFQLVINAYNAIHDSLKNPNSLTVYGVKLYDKDTVVIRFTATNGFGGTVTDYAAYNGELLFDCEALYKGEEIFWEDVLEYNETLE